MEKRKNMTVGNMLRERLNMNKKPFWVKIYYIFWILFIILIIRTYPKEDMSYRFKMIEIPRILTFGGDGEFGSLLTNQLSNSFALEGKDGRDFYFVTDDKGKHILLALPKFNSYIINFIHDYLNTYEKETYLLFIGKVEYITDQVKSEVIEHYNTIAGYEVATEDNYNDYIKVYYLNSIFLQGKNYIFFILTIIIFLIFILITYKKYKYIKANYSATTYFQNGIGREVIEFVCDDIDSPSTFCLDKNNIYLLRHGLISLKNNTCVMVFYKGVTHVTGRFVSNSKYLIEMHMDDNRVMKLYVYNKVVTPMNERKVLEIIRDRVANVGKEPNESMRLNESTIHDKKNNKYQSTYI